MLDVGELYIWGREEGEGRLGLGPGRGPDHAGGLSIPCKVKELPFPVAAVSCGGFFTLALTEEGQLWNWGGNCYILYVLFSIYFVLENSTIHLCCVLVLENSYDVNSGAIAE
jgi:alpha-tubulin suppressor-like RCC1 family protein